MRLFPADPSLGKLSLMRISLRLLPVELPLVRLSLIRLLPVGPSLVKLWLMRLSLKLLPVELPLVRLPLVWLPLVEVR
jgi:hypothetical protein